MFWYKIFQSSLILVEMDVIIVSCVSLVQEGESLVMLGSRVQRDAASRRA